MAASNLPEFQHRLRVEGEGGRIVLEGDFNGGEVTTLTVTSEDKSETREFEPDDAVGNMIDAFVRSAQEGTDFQPTGSEGKKLVETVCAAIESMKGRRSVKVGDMQRPG
jgi:predicted dehydrogenase